jgi:hypothetical protein
MFSQGQVRLIDPYNFNITSGWPFEQPDYMIMTQPGNPDSYRLHYVTALA